MAYYTGYNGAVKEVTQLPVGYNGSVVQSDSLYGGYQGVKKLVFGRYRWEKWELKITHEYLIVDGNKDEVGAFTDDQMIELCKSIYVADGTIKPSGLKITQTMCNIFENALHKQYPYYFYANQNEWHKINKIIQSFGSFYFGTYLQLVQTNDIVGKGDNLIEIVQGGSISDYPDNGEKDGFWYVKIQ